MISVNAADEAINMLDLAHNAGDSIGEYIFSGSSGRYRARRWPMPAPISSTPARGRWSGCPT